MLGACNSRYQISMTGGTESIPFVACLKRLCINRTNSLFIRGLVAGDLE